MNKLMRLALTSARETLRFRGDLLGASGFLVLILFVFSRLWQAVPHEGSAWSAGRLLLYLLVTELACLAPRAIHAEIAREVRSGDLAVQLLRPVHYVHWQVARAMGASIATCGWLLLTAGPVAWALSGFERIDPRGAAAGLLVLVPLAILVESSARVLLGLLAFWMEEVNAFYWIWQKAGFLLGGLLLPLTLYPDWLRRIASATPFAAQFFGAARSTVVFDAGEAARTAVVLAAWAAAFLVLLHVVHSRASRAVQAQGG